MNEPNDVMTLDQLAMTLVNQCNEILKAVSIPEDEPSLYSAWKKTRSGPYPITNDPVVYIELLGVRVREAIATTTTNLRTGKCKPEYEEAAAYNTWLQTLSDLIYIANIAMSKHPAIIEAMQPLREEPALYELLADIALTFNERISLIWAHPDAPEICDYQKEKRGIRTSHDTEH